MSIPEARKLRRGLKELSPLFHDTPETPRPWIESPEPLLEVLSVVSADTAGDSFFLNSFMASQIASAEKPSSLFSFQYHRHEDKPLDNEFFSPYLRRFSLSWDQFEEVCRWPIHRDFLASPFAQLLFFDFESFSLPQFEKAVTLIDKWIFVLRPTYESMTETYKLMKAALHVNPAGAYFVLLEGPVDGGKGSYLFEKFSSFVAKYLGIQIYGLGYLDFAQGSEQMAAALNLDSLFLEAPAMMNSPEKIALAEFIQASSILPRANAV